MLVSISLEQVESIEGEVGELAMQVTGHKTGKPSSPLEANLMLNIVLP